MSTRSAIPAVEIVVGITFICLSSHPLPYAIFIKIDGITGESKDAKHKGEIEFVYKEQKPDGTLGSGDKVAWDIKTNKVS